MPKKLEIIGKKFGRLFVVSFSHSKMFRFYNCVCDCGNKKVIKGVNLVNGDTKSCGCLSKELFSKMITKHKMAGTRFYRIYKKIKQRCNNKNEENYFYYGGKGIKVCKRWEKFENFRDDMYKSYCEHVKKFGEKQTTIDRKNFNKNYTKSNCRWATYKEQGNNKKQPKPKIIFEHEGKKKTIYQLSKDLGIGYSALYHRIFIYKWPIGKALKLKKNSKIRYAR